MIKFMLFHGAAEQSAVLFIPENYGTRTISKNYVKKRDIMYIRKLKICIRFSERNCRGIFANTDPLKDEF